MSSVNWHQVDKSTYYIMEALSKIGQETFLEKEKELNFTKKVSVIFFSALPILIVTYFIFYRLICKGHSSLESSPT